ncbi:fimbria/pilus outer membrane usher protein [Salmonella enterica subsp. enterica serovar Kentucky]|nr:fimbria/pilus outer membrane usher protein [Salmonella enterica subsp. enterica serovar Kentucky]
MAHSEGITLSQPLGESMAIISAPGARGAHVINNGGVEVDWIYCHECRIPAYEGSQGI